MSRRRDFDFAHGKPTGNTNTPAASATAALLVTPRPPEELRAAQLAIATRVASDPRLNDGWEREADLMELLDIFGLYRRI